MKYVIYTMQLSLQLSAATNLIRIEQMRVSDWCASTVAANSCMEQALI